MRKRMLLVAVLSLALVGVGVAPQLSARVSGEEYRLRVQPVDPIDPFRGAYVALDYPDLPSGESLPRSGEQVFVPLVESGGHWVGGSPTPRRPGSGPYLACTPGGWVLRCGIDDWFLPQSDARALEEAVGRGHVVARVRVDRWGHAALVGVEPG